MYQIMLERKKRDLEVNLSYQGLVSTALEHAASTLGASKKEIHLNLPIKPFSCWSGFSSRHLSNTVPSRWCFPRFTPLFGNCCEDFAESSQSPRKYRQAHSYHLLLSTLASLFAYQMSRYLFNESLCVGIVSWSVCHLSVYITVVCFLKRGGGLRVVTVLYHIKWCQGKAWGWRWQKVQGGLAG